MAIRFSFGIIWTPLFLVVLLGLNFKLSESGKKVFLA